MFQDTVQEAVAGIPGARNLSGDIICFGSNQAEHNRALDATLHRVRSSGLTVNKQKCKFNKKEINFFGFIFSAAGLRLDSKKVQALHDAPRPQNASEMRSFLGMAQYSAGFIDNFATIIAPLRALTKQDTENTLLAYFDPQKAHRNSR